MSRNGGQNEQFRTHCDSERGPLVALTIWPQQAFRQQTVARLGRMDEQSADGVRGALTFGKRRHIAPPRKIISCPLLAAERFNRMNANGTERWDQTCDYTCGRKKYRDHRQTGHAKMVTLHP
jgi:hypothetical protein